MDSLEGRIPSDSGEFRFLSSGFHHLGIGIHHPSQTPRGGPIPHFDLSFWAAEKLAHPIQAGAG